MNTTESLNDSKFAKFSAMPKESLFQVVGGKFYPTSGGAGTSDQATDNKGLDGGVTASGSNNDGYGSPW